MLDIPKIQIQIKNKINMLFNEVRNFPEISNVMIDYLLKLKFSNLKSLVDEESYLIRRFKEIAYPLELEFHPPNHEYGDSLDGSWAIRALNNKLIIGIDTSEIAPTPHVTPLFLLVNVGFQAINYGDRSSHFNGSKPFFYVYSELAEEIGGIKTVPSWTLEIKRLENELKVISELIDLPFKSEYKIVFFDESFSISYLMARDQNFRNKIIQAMDELQCKLRDLNIIPIGIFYTRSKAFTYSVIKSIICSNVKCSECSFDIEEKPCKKYSIVRDLALFNEVLKIGWRSPVFEVKSQITSQFRNFKVLAFYVKVGSGNLFRVEFPDWCLDYIDLIHDVVLAQSIIGRGYPYVLERAHEEAYISSSERRWLLNYIDKLIRGSGGSGLVLSGKFKRKIRGVL